MKATPLFSPGLRRVVLAKLSLSFLWVAALGPSASAQIPSYVPLQASKMPPAGWQDVSWNDIGGWTTIDVTTAGLPANDPSIDASVALQNIISSTSGNRILYFPSGRYHFKTTLVITTGNLRLRGNGKTNTTFILEAPATSAASIQFRGSGTGGAIPVSSEVTLGTDTLTFASAAAISTIVPGDFIRLYANNWVVDGLHDRVGQIFRVLDKTDATLSLDMKSGLAMPTNPTPPLTDRDPVIEKLNMVANVGVENLTIHRVRLNDDWSDNCSFAWVYNGRMIDLESSYCVNAHLAVPYSKRVVIENCDVHDGFDFGGGGHGYGINVSNDSTQVRASNNKLWNLRTHIITSQGANHCVFSYNSCEDENFGSGNGLLHHGRYSHNNLFEGNRSPYNMVCDASHGENGPRNTFYRNYAEAHVGNLYASTVGTNVIGNITSFLEASGSSNYFGANRENGTVVWGVFASNQPSSIPTSLYTTTKPAFLGSKPWPIYGLGVNATWGISNTLPSTDRAKPAAPVVLFRDDFQDNNATGWGTSGGSWGTISEGTIRYRQTSTTGTALALVGNAYEDYVVSAKFKTMALGTGGTGPCLVFRAVDASNYYFFQLRPDNKVRLYKVIAGLSQVIDEEPFTFSVGVDYIVSVAVAGDDITCYVGGNSVITITHVEPALRSGRIGVRTYATSARFDDVTIVQ